MKIGLDIDNTLTDTMDLVAQYWTDLGYQTDKNDLSFQGSYITLPNGMTEQDRAYQWEDGSDWLMDAELFPGAKAVVSLLQEHEIHLITARTPGNDKIQQVTKDWLQEQGFEYDSLSHEDGKVALVKELQIDLMFEDNPTEAVSIANAGIPVLLKDQPYNKDVNHPLISRFSHWAEVPWLLKKITE